MNIRTGPWSNEDSKVCTVTVGYVGNVKFQIDLNAIHLVGLVGYSTNVVQK